MTVTLNLNSMHIPKEVKQLSEVEVAITEMDLSAHNGYIHTKTELMNLDELQELIKTNKYRPGNFQIVKGIPKPLDEMFSPSKESISPTVTSKGTGETVVSILLTLAKANTEILFLESYYKDHTSGKSFENFIPNLNDTELWANSLIISRKKFNIVLTASIKGELMVDGGYTEMYRYFPFKLVKFGEIMFPRLLVKVTDRNEEFLTKIGADIQPERTIAEIDLRNYPIFEEENINCSAPNFLYLLRDIRKLRARLNGYRYYLNILRNEMDVQGIPYDKREWFSGEEVDDEYLGDEGTTFVEVWEKGQQNAVSLQTLLSQLDKFGEGVEILTSAFSRLHNVESSQTKDGIAKLTESVTALFKAKTLDEYEVMAMVSLIDALTGTGLHHDRYLDVKLKIKKHSLELNALEMKLQTLRWNIYKENFDVNRLGEVLSRTKDKTDILAPQGKIVIKQGKIEKDYSQSLTATISEKIGE